MTYLPTYPDIEELHVDLDSLIQPLESLIHSMRAQGQEIEDPINVISNGLLKVGLFVADADGHGSKKGNISDAEACIILNLYRIVRGASEAVFQPREFRLVLQSMVNEDPQYYRPSVPDYIRLLEIYDRNFQTDFAEKGKTVAIRFANTVAKADGKLSAKEKFALDNLRSALYGPDSIVIERPKKNAATAATKAPAPENEPAGESIDGLLNELNSLVGLGSVKTDVAQLVNFLKVQQMRQAKGAAQVAISKHLVCYGNPGTGKTTVARLLAKIYKSLNVLSKGHLIETERSGLVGGYLGQTAIKVKEVVNSALGGILFIDEAYALKTRDDDSFGQEAIDTLLKLMEDHRDDLIIVVAGYTGKMQEFLSTNPGLRSRFNKYLSFEDYNPLQLVTIFEHFCEQVGYRISQGAIEKLLSVFRVMYLKRNESFGNGRLARNLFEKTINRQADRIVGLSNITEHLLFTIEEIDVPGEAELSEFALAY